MRAARCGLFVIIVLAATAAAAAPAGIHELLSKHIEALGGTEAIRSLATISVEAEIEMLGMGIEGTMESYSARPCLSRSDISLGFFAVKQGYDGERMWRLDPNGMLTFIRDEQSIRDHVTMCIVESYRYITESDFFPMEAAGIDTIEGVICTVAELAPEGGTPCRLYFDSNTHLLKRFSMDTATGAVHETYDDYRPVGGLMVPFVSRIHQVALDRTVEVRARTISHNEYIDPIVFMPPAAAARDYAFSSGSSAELIPFTYYDNHIYLPVRIIGSGEDVMFMLDSGASMTVIDSTFAAEMEFPLGERMVGAGAGGMAYFYMTKIPGFGLEGVRFGEQTVIAYPLRGIMSRFADIDVRGILGYDFLSRFVTRIDYERTLISLFEPDSFVCGAGAVGIEAPLLHNVFSIEAALDSIHRGTFLIDTGAGNSMLQKSFTDGRRLQEGRKTLEITILGAGGEEHALLARFDSFEIGGFTVEDPVMVLSGAEAGIAALESISGIIGNDILHRFDLTLDYMRQRIYLEPNGLLTDPFVKDRSGIRCERHEDGRVTIYSIIPGSPADVAGLAEGDEIVSVDGKMVADMETMEELYEILEGRDRESLLLEIARDGVTSSVSLALEDYL